MTLRMLQMRRHWHLMLEGLTVRLRLHRVVMMFLRADRRRLIH